MNSSSPRRFAILALSLSAMTVWAQTEPFITIQPASQTAVAGSNLALTVAVAGDGPFRYQWLFNGAELSDTVFATVAGTRGVEGYSGDGGAATNARLWRLVGLAFDAAGNLFIADNVDQVVRKVDTSGIISTVAGNRSSGFSGDGGAATNASLYYPSGLAVDQSGNLFIADEFNNRVRRVDANGVITTVAGNGQTGFSGDGGAATNATLYNPTGVAVDSSGHLFIADHLNQRVRQVGGNGIITTSAGNGQSGYAGDGGAATEASLSYPFSLAMDASENLLIVDQGNGRIRRVDTGGTISTLATIAALSEPTGVAADSSGNLFIAETGANRILQTDTTGTVSTFTSSFPVWSVAVAPSGSVFFTDDNCVREASFSGSPTWTIASLSSTNAGDYQVVITSPYGSVTSAVATVSTALPPLNAALNASGLALLTFKGTPGSLYAVQTTDNLSPPVNWQSASTNAADNKGNWSFTDPRTLNSSPRFYRLEAR
jgi:sugar lactone lactonase YvrE